MAKPTGWPSSTRAPKQGRDFPLEAALDMEPRLREIRTAGQREEQLFTHALKLEGLLRHASKHAAGLVISPTALVDHLPLFVDKEGSVLTQFAGPEVDAIGLIKFDFLGLKTLTLLANTVSRITKTRGREINLSTLPLDDGGHLSQTDPRRHRRRLPDGGQRHPQADHPAETQLF